MTFFLCLATAFTFRQVRQQRQTPYLTVIGGVNMADGLGRQSMEMIQALEDSIKIGFIPTYIHSSVDVPPPLLPRLTNRKKKQGPIVFCQEPLDESCKRLKPYLRDGQIRIAYSMLESTAIPSDWVERINTHFDLVAVPDRFLIEVYRNSGVAIPIFELPLARNLSSFLSAPLKKSRNSVFIFGSFGAGIGRKNHVGLIRAFHKAFKGRSDVCLALHCRSFYGRVRQQIHEEIEKADGVLIRLTEGALDQDSYCDFLKSIDCYVSPSKGEGFSIQPREAMALGIPVIVADNTGQHTICESGFVRAVPSPIEEAAVYEWSSKDSLGSFFLCTEDDLSAALLDVERNYENYLSKSSFARGWASQYDYQQLTPLYLGLLRPIEIILGAENKITEGALITSSVELYKKFNRLKNPMPTWVCHF